jgi:predicted aspartyl protease
MRAFCVLALGFVASAATPHAATTPVPGVTPFVLGPGAVVVAVRLNARGPFRLLLDTGSTHTSISSRTAEAIGAPVIAKAPMGSSAGSRITLVVAIESLEIGPVVVGDVQASIVELDGIPGGDGIDGVIGQDALASVRYTIDYRQRRVVWWPDSALDARGSSLSLEPSHGRFLVTLDQRQSRLRLVPDSGADSLLLFAPKNSLPVTRFPAPATLTTPSGATEVRLAKVRELSVGTLTLRDVPAVVAERDRSEPDEVDGLLPLHLFDRVTIDGPRQRMIVEKFSETRRLMFF